DLAHPRGDRFKLSLKLCLKLRHLVSRVLVALLVIVAQKFAQRCLCSLILTERGFVVCAFRGSLECLGHTLGIVAVQHHLSDQRFDGWRHPPDFPTASVTAIGVLALAVIPTTALWLPASRLGIAEANEQ